MSELRVKLERLLSLGNELIVSAREPVNTGEYGIATGREWVQFESAAALDNLSSKRPINASAKANQ
jgi:hypothetical protein